MRKSAAPLFASRIRAIFLVSLTAMTAIFGIAERTAQGQGGRVIRAVGGTAQPGQQTSVVIEIDSQGNESSASFTVNFDTSRLSNPSATIGTGVPGGSSMGVNVNQVAQGRVGVLIDSVNTYFPGTRHMLTLTFTVPAGAQPGLAVISFGGTPTPQSVSSPAGALLPTTYQSGSVNVGGVTPSPTPTVAPSPTPTVEPSPTPTVAPSPTPTVAPSPTPTVEPSPTPTVAPSPTPTVAPSPTPTVAPSPTPTVEPSPTPTVAPSPTPTVAPSPTPTVAPSPTPTVAPSPTPTVGPSPTPNTQPGTNVLVQAPGNLVSATFAFVFQPGNTVFSPVGAPSAGFPPAGYDILDDGPHYGVQTTAPFAGPVTVCIFVPGVTDPEQFARLRVLHRENGVVVDRTVLAPDASAPNFATRTVCARVEVPDVFFVAVGPVFNVSGRVLTPGGQGLRNAIVIMTDSRGVRYTATTSSFGAYNFENARVGEQYTLSVQSRRYRFTPRIVTVNGHLSDMDFVGLE